MTFFFIFLALITFMQLYFLAASKYRIVDKPNDRSSHTLPTIRGGGVIFVAGLLLWFVIYGFSSPYFILGAMLIALISFMDDIREQPAAVRLAVHLSAFLLMAWELSLFSNLPWWALIVVFIVCIGALNAFNFMDGINGITGAYALVTLLTLLAIDWWIVDFVSPNLILVLMISVLVFLLYNFRKKARCFAGDVGSVTLAFVLIFLVLQLIMKSGNYGWFVLFVIYGVETVVTILYRLANRENILKAHRSHVYQYMANELGYSHLAVSSGYALAQAVVNLVVIFYFPHPSFAEGFLIVVVIGMTYIAARERIMARVGKQGLLNRLFSPSNKS